MNNSEINPSPELLARHAPLTPVYGCSSLVAHIAPDVFGLWLFWEEETGGEREIPYWTVVWPGAAVLAQYILDNSTTLVKEKRVLDLGCGGALPAIAAFHGNAKKIVANDIDHVALHIATLNARANNASLTLNSDNLVDRKYPGNFDLLLAGDLFYERGTAEKTLSFLWKARESGARVLIADGERKYAPRTGVVLLRECIMPVNKELEGIDKRKVRLLELE
ncbi:MAG: methyltransferase [Chitinivibrionales bacterium]|nr:methyltransferase [Chitinivibrionales bacterium]